MKQEQIMKEETFEELTRCLNNIFQYQNKQTMKNFEVVKKHLVRLLLDLDKEFKLIQEKISILHNISEKLCQSTQKIDKNFKNHDKQIEELQKEVFKKK